MQQIYHANAKTNVHIRAQIQKSSTVSNSQLAFQLNLSTQTVSKWKNRNFLQDVSSRPHNIHYALTDLESALIVSIRKSSWIPLDEIYEMLLEGNNQISRSSVYRCLSKNNINKVPEEQKDKAKKFKAYDPGYLHMDVTYLPQFNGKKKYLFVAIDRATRALFYQIYDDKSANSTDLFFDQCASFFPFKITHILTDNGLEFTNSLIKSKKGNLCTKPSLLDIKCNQNNIEHRLTKPSTPKTNGMVERVNGTIKNNTILISTYQNPEQMNHDLIRFLVFYNLFRRHGSLRKELHVKTPFDAIQKWFVLKPEIFILTPDQFKNKILNLQHQFFNSYQQPCET